MREERKEGAWHPRRLGDLWNRSPWCCLLSCRVSVELDPSILPSHQQTLLHTPMQARLCTRTVREAFSGSYGEGQSFRSGLLV